MREFFPGDEKLILELFNTAFGKKLDLNLWKWRYLNNPYGEGIIRLMFDHDKLVGHYAVTPVPLMIKGKTQKAALSMTTMTHPSYEGRGIFTQLASETYKYSKHNGIKVIFGFPNETSHHGFIKKLDWYSFGHISGWTFTGTANDRVELKKYKIHEINNADKRIDNLWTQIREQSKIMIPRTAEYINWRYLNKPGNEYMIYGLFESEDSLNGIVILKIYRDLDSESEPVGNIVDLITKDNTNTHKALLRKALEYFADNAVTTITTWAPTKQSCYSVLDNMSFCRSEWQTNFGFKLLDNVNVDETYLSDYTNWSFMMGESDVF